MHQAICMLTVSMSKSFSTRHVIFLVHNSTQKKYFCKFEIISAEIGGIITSTVKHLDCHHRNTKSIFSTEPKCNEVLTHTTTISSSPTFSTIIPIPPSFPLPSRCCQIRSNKFQVSSAIQIRFTKLRKQVAIDKFLPHSITVVLNQLESHKTYLLASLKTF